MVFIPLLESSVTIIHRASIYFVFSEHFQKNISKIYLLCRLARFDAFKVSGKLFEHV